MKNKNILNRKEVIIEYSQEEIAQMKAEGIDNDAIPAPGKHVFRRGGFMERHPNHSRKESKARINIYIDMDVLDYFRSRAEKPNSAPYQTQINYELRSIMERDLANEVTKPDTTAEKLLKDDEFLEKLSEKLKEKELVSV